ncbi:hypothetical protein GF324_11145 [bacterium]|nr:hypothetical protein [bacterium]
MAGSSEHLLREILETQHETQRLVHFLAHRMARELIEVHLTKQIERRVYELSDGLRSSRDIEKHINKQVTQRTVVSWWQKWQKLGLVEPSRTYSGRVRKLIGLEELGLHIDPNL